MFRRDPQDADPGTQSQRNTMGRGPMREDRRVAAWIGASIHIKGDLVSSEDMTIAGRVDGDVSVPEHGLVIAPGARIRGNIVARAVVVRGEVRGTITANAKVEIDETAVVEGDIRTPRIAIAEGGVLNGRIGIETPEPAVV